ELIDTVAPALSLKPQDVEVHCSSIPDPPMITATDACGKSVNVIYSQSFIRTTQNQDSCDFYNYTIERMWQASDDCGNTTSHIQRISVTDENGPQMYFDNDIQAANCLILSADSVMNLIDSIVECSAFTLDYQDSISQDGCLTVVLRTYSLSDVCGNQSSYVQR